MNQRTKCHERQKAGLIHTKHDAEVLRLTGHKLQVYLQDSLWWGCVSTSVAAAKERPSPLIGLAGNKCPR